MRGVFRVDEAKGERWSAALDLFRLNEAFSLGKVTFRRLTDTVVEAATASTWRLENLTPSRAAADLKRTQSLVQELLTDDAEFRGAIADALIDYILVDDYDTGSVALCRLRGDELDWLIPRPS